MEMEGRSYTEFHRNTSEDMFIKTMMESSIGMPAPTMEMLGFKNLTQSFRTDSEELFKSWLTNGENNGSHPTNAAHRPRQASRRISTELASLTNQIGGIGQKMAEDTTQVTQTTSVADDLSNDLHSNRPGAEKGLHGSNLFLAKAWFHSSQPMTRSRSSELRRRYAAMQNSQTAIGMEAMHNVSGNGANHFKQETTEANGFNIIPTSQTPNQYSPFMSPSHSSSSTFHNQQIGNMDKISSVVSMLKGTLERKKLSNQIEKETANDSSFGYYSTEILGSTCLNQGGGVFGCENQGSFQDVSTIGVREAGVLQMIEESLLEGIMDPVNPTQMRTFSREPSQSESSAAAPVISNGFEICDDPCVSAQGPSVCESSRYQMGNGRSPENSSRTKDFRECIYDNLKDNQKKRGLIRYGSVNSSCSVERGDPTKKRRVERSRKMAEAKERSSIPTIPSDMQSILKRCENLEKEVRSLKLNLAFMNRKDSEQTKQIEELQKQNKELGEEKERLLEEIERIISETGKIFL
ncbi:protein CYCLOPS-like isoform X1 [Primulina tabacum]|uniref:protein CYCLOPS-like isoform X1 n=1 Tax=Primulina tabacum TaxID=48773 RepID=UPI003F5AA3B2